MNLASSAAPSFFILRTQHPHLLYHLSCPSSGLLSWSTIPRSPDTEISHADDVTLNHDKCPCFVFVRSPQHRSLEESHLVYVTENKLVPFYTSCATYYILFITIQSTAKIKSYWINQRSLGNNKREQKRSKGMKMRSKGHLTPTVP